MDFITAFFGRFHPLIVHLPIGILFLAFVFECLALREQYKILRKAVQPALLLGAIFAAAAAITGYFLRQEGGYDEVLADRHQNMGIITALLALVVYAVRPKVRNWVDVPRQRHIVKLALSVPLMVCLIATGHWGGSLTHGEDYLFAVISTANRSAQDPAERIRAVTNIEEAVLYNDVIQPILEGRCYDCHSSSKQKGDLRLDGAEFIRRGGKDGAVLASGPADSSALYKRIALPQDHKEHMPPVEKPQLSSSEIALIQYWVEEGASFDKPVSAFRSREKIASIVKGLQQAPQRSWIPGDEVSEADEKTLRKLRDLNIHPMPLAEANGYLMVTFTGRKDVSDEQIHALANIRDQLVWLNLSYSSVTDHQLEEIARLTNLRVLYLNGTAITDAGIAKLSNLSELRWLTVVGAQVTDASATTLAQLKKLDNLFVYQTQITRKGISRLIEGNKELRIDTGNYNLEKLPTDTVVYRRTSK